MKKYILILFCYSFIVSCESSEDDIDQSNNIPDQQLSVEWVKINSLGKFDGAEIFNFTEAYWDNDGIHFQGSTQSNPDQNGFINYVSVKDLIIGGTGQIKLLDNPKASISVKEKSFTSNNIFNAVYSTDVSPDFWISGYNNADLILGGTGFTPSAYYHSGGSVIQGGYVKVTDYNERYISGELYFAGWRYNNELNREVMSGVYLIFSGVEYK